MNLHIHGHVLPEDIEKDIYVVEGHITFQKVKSAQTVVKNGYIIPGLVDAHAHLSINSPAGDDVSPKEAAQASATKHLHAGVLVIREPGSPDYSALDLHVRNGFPRIQTAGRFLTPHGKYFPGLAREIDEENLPNAAAQELKKSGAWVKVIGDFFNEKGDHVPNFKLETLKKTVERVHGLGGRIATHVVSTGAIERAIEAGFDSIEHGTGLQESHIKELVKRKIAFTPTMTIREGIVELVKGSGTPSESRKLIKAVQNQALLVRKAFEAGVTVLAGTDAGMVEHGIVFEEVDNFLSAGVDPKLALGSGSWNARKYLGYKGIVEGEHADLVVYNKNPMLHPEVLKTPAFIMLDGREVHSKHS